MFKSMLLLLVVTFCPAAHADEYTEQLNAFEKELLEGRDKALTPLPYPDRPVEIWYGGGDHSFNWSNGGKMYNLIGIAGNGDGGFECRQPCRIEIWERYAVPFGSSEWLRLSRDEVEFWKSTHGFRINPSDVKESSDDYGITINKQKVNHRFMRRDEMQEFLAALKMAKPPHPGSPEDMARQQELLNAGYEVLKSYIASLPGS